MLKSQRINYPKKIIIGHLNINSIRNKFVLLQEIVESNLDIFLITESKIDDSFPNSQFSIPDYRLFRKDRNVNGGGLLLYVNQNIPGKIINSFVFEFEILAFEFSVANKKWLLLGIYKPPSVNEDAFFREIIAALNSYSSDYENFILMGDFNATTENHHLKDLLNSFAFDSLIKEPTCFKSTTPTCIDLILTNHKNVFMKSSTFETGLSDFHKLTTTIMKKNFEKGNPRILYYRNYKNFDKNIFKQRLNNKLSLQTSSNFSLFYKSFLSILNDLAPIKKKMLRYNNSPFMNKALRKAIMLRSKLKNKYNKYPSYQNSKNYKKQRNICVNLLRKTKKEYFSNLNLKNVKDSKSFWKVVKPLFSDKEFKGNNIILKENDKLVRNDLNISNIMNDYFVNISKNLEIKPSEVDPSKSLHEITKTFKNHHSIQRIKCSYASLKNVFNFSSVDEEEVREEINNLSLKKATIKGDIPVNILKENIEIYISYLTNTINDCIRNGFFPQELKLAVVSPLFKKKDNLDKENYRPVSVLTHLSKVFERILYKQIDFFMAPKFSRFLCGFRKNHNSQYSLLKMIETWKNNLDQGKIIGAIFMDLSKAFDTIDHGLLLAKLEAYGFSENAASLLQSYVCNRYQKVCINGTFSESKQISAGVPQGSILGPLLFNIFLNDIFWHMTNSNISNYADDNTLYSMGHDLALIKKQLEDDFSNILKWFYENHMVLNSGKCHYMIFGPHDVNEKINLNGIEVVNTEEQEILGITLDNELSFKTHIQLLCRKSGQKINALARIANYLSPYKKKIIMTSVIKSQFGYCPLIWMFCSRALNKSINHIHERALSIIYEDSLHLSFQDLLNLSNEQTIHQNNLRYLAIEIYKYINKISPPIMQDFFILRENTYNIRNFNTLYCSNKKTVKYGTETILYRGSLMWSNLPIEVKESTTLAIFKKNIKNNNKIECSCRLCKNYIQNIGFI